MLSSSVLAPTKKLIMATCLCSALVGLYGCQKTDETTKDTDSNAAQSSTASQPADTVPSTEVQTMDTQSQTVEDVNDGADTEIIDAQAMQQEQSQQASAINTDPANADSSAGATASTTKNAAPTSETQVTDVEYKDGQGRSVYVTFQTSATATLQANLMMPSGKRVLLTAPTGQGNNPTYRSIDGSIELVTHGGGNNIDLIYQGKPINFTAVDSDTEVIKPQKSS
ncbi:hypothetical protein DLE54_02485 [Psychrobacter sp. YP14]|jgi:hypothetical protein|uniref:Lipoprotein n=1 Tax=Psychrobacter raelei TaxID=2565531 RepID=A0AAT9PEJ1_9GAMM|nr:MULTISPECIES: hypothetical protein [unclassified Psychrobacter]AWT48512.1 hypothetical protein DLE54_02485 [Psychrobacter sp. YP14]UNK05802.1 hypothetical protein MN210_03150 [Psychrobacter sp. PraFG1]